MRPYTGNKVIYLFDNVGTFLKKSPLNSPLASSKTYGQLTPPIRTSCRVIQRIIFEWEYSPAFRPQITGNKVIKTMIQGI